MSVGRNDIFIGKSDLVTQSENIRVGILNYPGAQRSAALGLEDLLSTIWSKASDFSRKNIQTCAEGAHEPLNPLTLVGGGSVTYANSLKGDHLPGSSKDQLRFSVSHWPLDQPGTDAKTNDAQLEFEVLIIPPSHDVNKIPPPQPDFTGWITRQHDGGVLICSICAGAFVLAGTGLLNNRKATTHWSLRDKFEATYPPGSHRYRQADHRRRRHHYGGRYDGMG